MPRMKASAARTINSMAMCSRACSRPKLPVGGRSRGPRGSVMQANLRREFRADFVNVGERELCKWSVPVLDERKEARGLGSSPRTAEGTGSLYVPLAIGRRRRFDCPDRARFGGQFAA